VYGNGSYYISTNTYPNIASAVISGNSAVISALSYGSTSISVCETGGSCGTIYVSVSNNNQTVTTTNGSTSFLFASPSNPSMLAGQTTSVSLSGGVSGGVYSVVYNSNSSVVSTSISGNILSLSGIRNGYAVIVACDSLTDCVPVSVSVGVIAPTTTTTTSPSTTGVRYVFTQYLSVGSTGTEVTELQERLTSEGVYSGPITGTFGPLTEAAVEKYQSAHGLVVSGIVGSITRGVLNAG